MEQLFNISERFSSSLDDVRGPERKKQFLKKAEAWIKASAARRGAAKTIAYGGLSLCVGALGVFLYKGQSRQRKSVSEVKHIALETGKVGDVNKALSG
jgi:hypothetical protein